MSRRVRVVLSDGDRRFLESMVRRGEHKARAIARARVLLALDESDGSRVPSRAEAARRCLVSKQTVSRVAAKWEATRGAAATVSRKERPSSPREPKVTGDVEVRIIAMACSTPPEGRARWTLRLLERHVKLDDGLPDLDHSTIGVVLKKGGLRLT
ncbi:helix-turn-helix domain-containing protein [Bifidobacterium myosotis]|uniref:Helix-turn-helix domain-containing protein n=1 Tax=Bifidobacterium myosotis TaxID=1630166 RepID=A0A5M9ZQX1_9BIFI|nr:helix-turn-helix domain-containing protein [Bifidobacterium myosotis]KAA8829855.1 helix-turn-helix domain-containing protein [Bifidobacterium myosotis]